MSRKTEVMEIGSHSCSNTNCIVGSGYLHIHETSSRALRSWRARAHGAALAARAAAMPSPTCVHRSVVVTTARGPVYGELRLDEVPLRVRRWRWRRADIGSWSRDSNSSCCIAVIRNATDAPSPRQHHGSRSASGARMWTGDTPSRVSGCTRSAPSRSRRARSAR